MVKRLILFIIAICSFVYMLHASYMDISYFHADMQNGADYVFVKGNSYFILFLSIVMTMIMVLAIIIVIANSGKTAQKSLKANIIGLIIFVPIFGAGIYVYNKSEDYVLAQAAEKGYTVCVSERTGSRRAGTTIFALTANEQYCRGFKDMGISVKAAKKRVDTARER